jgi:Ca2+-transporting ATPase
MTPEELPSTLSVFSRWKGLSDTEAAERLEQEGANELPSERAHSLGSIAIDVLREPMFLLLIGTATIYSLLGDLQETAALLVATVVIIGITVYQT